MVLCTLLGKYASNKRHIQPHQKKLTWALPFALQALNSAPRRALSKGLIGYCPVEIFHGTKPVLPFDEQLKIEEEVLVQNTPAGMEDMQQALLDSILLRNLILED